MTIYYISSGHKDGLGGNIRHLIKANIYAKNHNYEFINFCNPLIRHSKPFYKTFSLFSRYKKLGDLPDHSKIFVYGDKYSVEVIELIKTEFSYKKFEIIEDSSNEIYEEIVQLPYDQELREYHQKIFHSRDNSKYNMCHPGYINIVMHVRRGDVWKKVKDGTRLDYMKRLTKSVSYIKAVKHLMKVLPKNFKIILFSEGKEEDFMDFRERFHKIEMYIDREEWRYIIDNEETEHPDYEKAVDNLKKMIVTGAKAEIFLGAKSHLSHILAYLNKNYCFFEGYFYEKLNRLKRIHFFDRIPEIINKDTFGKKD